MSRVVASFHLALFFALAPGSAHAQLVEAKAAPIVYGHHHINATDIEEHKKFWVDTLGGVATKSGPTEVVKFQNVFIFFAKKAPTAGSSGSTADHLGLQVPNLRATVDKLRAAGYPIVTKEELPANVKADVQDGIAFILPARTTAVAFVMGPEGTKLELVENKVLTVPIALHHVHFATPQVAEMKAWYEKVFGAKVPGVALLFAEGPMPVTGTRGRVVDHIGFEVRNLEAFTKQLDVMGIKSTPYTKVPGRDLAISFVTDPWGTAIELSEGLSRLE